MRGTRVVLTGLCGSKEREHDLHESPRLDSEGERRERKRMDSLVSATAHLVQHDGVLDETGCHLRPLRAAGEARGGAVRTHSC